ncbi:MAG: hypothetical protein JO261_11175 [Alphaproteobacteria bacterium]|nr:hypothetical protein [Alphaproteobacteria bacterium]MBV9694249.1 hypothetical protein [Alphaproteobacteria bacterium]
MSDDEFNRIFSGGAGAKASFAARIGRAEPPPPPPTAAPAESDATGVYKPYGFLPSGNIGETCDIQRWLDGTDIPEGTEFQYRYLLRVAYVGDEEIRLFLPDTIVVIEGKNLRDLRKKLARRQVTFICQYTAKVWPEVIAPNEPVVWAISLMCASA